MQLSFSFLISYYFFVHFSIYLCIKCCHCIRRKIVCKLNILAIGVNIILSLSVMKVSRGKNRKCAIIMLNFKEISF